MILKEKIYYFIGQLIRSPYYHIFLALYAFLLLFWFILHTSAPMDGFLICQPIPETIQYDFNIEKQLTKLEKIEFNLTQNEFEKKPEQNLDDLQIAALLNFTFWTTLLFICLLTNNIR